MLATAGEKIHYAFVMNKEDEKQTQTSDESGAATCSVPVFMCPECEGIYQIKVTQCDCHFGDQKWIEGEAIFPVLANINLKSS